MKKSVALLLSLFIIITSFVLPTKVIAYTAEDGALLVSASTTLNDEIRLNIYVSLPDSVLADETAYTVFTMNGETEKQYVKDVKDRPETVFEQTVYRFTYDVAPSDIYTKINFRLYGTVGGTANSIVPLYSATRDFTSAGFDYSVADYLKERIENSENEKMIALAKAMLDYGKAAAEYFGVEIGEDAVFSSEYAAFDRVPAMLKRYKLTSTNDTRPPYFENVGMQILVGPTVSYKVYIQFSLYQPILDYTITVNGETPEFTLEDDYTYSFTVENIKATALGDSIELAIMQDDETARYEFSGLSYAYMLATVNASTSAQAEKNVNLGKALYLYYQAAKTYFKGGYVSTYTGKKYNEITLDQEGVHYALFENELELEWVDHILDLIITKDMSTIDKILAVHDWMVLYIGYDYSNTGAAKNQLLYSALDGLTVCAGYSKLFYAFMYELKIPCEWITGNAGEYQEAHAWNAVKLDDGNWYFVDVTWDDPGMKVDGVNTSDFPNGENIIYDYFLIPLDVIQDDHTAESTLPSPLGDSSDIHDGIMGMLKERVAEYIQNEISKGRFGNANLFKSILEIELNSDYIGEAIRVSVEDYGQSTYTLRLFVPIDMIDMEEKDPLSDIFEALKDGFSYGTRSWGGYKVSYGINSRVRGVYYEIVFTFSKPD